jgi:hypothetical protein
MAIPEPQLQEHPSPALKIYSRTVYSKRAFGNQHLNLRLIGEALLQPEIVGDRHANRPPSEDDRRVKAAETAAPAFRAGP